MGDGRQEREGLACLPPLGKCVFSTRTREPRRALHRHRDLAARELGRQERPEQAAPPSALRAETQWHLEKAHPPQGR